MAIRRFFVRPTLPLLSQLEARRQVRSLAAYVTDQHPDIALTAISALGRLGDPRAVPALAQVVRMRDGSRLPEHAADALTQIKHPAAVDALLAIADLGSSVAAIAVSRCRDERAIPYLLAAVHRKTLNYGERAKVIAAFRNLNINGNSGVLDVLVKVLDDSGSGWEARAAAVASLLCIGPQGLAAISKHWIAGTNRAEILYALDTVGPRKAAGELDLEGDFQRFSAIRQRIREFVAGHRDARLYSGAEEFGLAYEAMKLEREYGSYEVRYSPAVWSEPSTNWDLYYGSSDDGVPGTHQDLLQDASIGVFPPSTTEPTNAKAKPPS